MCFWIVVVFAILGVFLIKIICASFCDSFIIVSSQWKTANKTTAEVTTLETSWLLHKENTKCFNF